MPTFLDAVPGILSSLGGGGGGGIGGALSGLFGGSRTTQNASNSTNVSLNSYLINGSPASGGGTASGSSSAPLTDTPAGNAAYPLQNIGLTPGALTSPAALTAQGVIGSAGVTAATGSTATGFLASLTSNEKIALFVAAVGAIVLFMFGGKK